MNILFPALHVAYPFSNLNTYTGSVSQIRVRFPSFSISVPVHNFLTTLKWIIYTRSIYMNCWWWHGKL